MPIEDVILNVRANFSDFNKVMRMSLDKFRQMNKSNVTIASTGAKVANTFRMMTHGMRGFRMEMLGVMFFGMAIERVFSSLLKPSLDMVGAFDIWNTTLALAFLPTALQVNDALLSILNQVLGLSPIMQDAINLSVIFGYVFGKLLALFGVLALGLGSLTLAFGSLSAAFGVLMIAVPILGIIAALVTLGFEMYKMGGPIKFMENVLRGIYNVWLFLFEWTVYYVDKIIDYIDKLIEKFNIFGKIKSVLGLGGGTSENPFDKIDKIRAGIPKKQFGGYIPTEGLYHLHAGENVTSANQTLNFSPTITINSSGGMMDIQRIKMELNEMWRNEVGRLARR